MTKQAHLIRIDDATWAALTEAAQAKDYAYRGRLNQGRVVEDLVRGAVRPADPPAPLPAPAPAGPQPSPRRTPAPAGPQPSPRRTPASAGPQQWRLAEIVARWPAAEQKRWQQDEWKVGAWVKRVLDTINAGL